MIIQQGRIQLPDNRLLLVSNNLSFEDLKRIYFSSVHKAYINMEKFSTIKKQTKTLNDFNINIKFLVV